MIRINWDPVGHLGPIPINWHGLGWAPAFLTGWWLTRRWARRDGVAREQVDDLLLWILLGTMAGARVYFIIQNDPVAHLGRCAVDSRWLSLAGRWNDILVGLVIAALWVPRGRIRERYAGWDAYVV